MKKINALVIKSFIGPFVLTFFLILFILLMQFVFKYLDDMMGKGIDFGLILELLAYKSTNLVAIALPLSVLLASIMTMGGLAENYELVALKAAGISLFKVLRGLIVFILLVSVGAFLFSNYVTPVANLKFKSLLYDIVNKKPLLEIKEGNFYGDMGDFVLRVDKKDEDGRMHDVLIYDHRPPNRGNGNVIRAKEAEMGKTISGRFLIFKLYNGTMYREMPDKKTTKRRNKTYTHLSTKFEKMTLRMDLSGFEFKETDDEKFSNHREMLNMAQLKEMADSLTIMSFDKNINIQNYLKKSFTINKINADSMSNESFDFDQVFAALPIEKKVKVMQTARNLKGNIDSYLRVGTKEVESRDGYIKLYWNEWHRKLTLSFACLILFFIGAPLGAIIKKGGLGLPFIISVGIFLVFHITSISGEKMARTGVLDSFEGMWLSSIILLPFSIFLSVLAFRETSLFEKETYLRLFRKTK